MKRVFRILVPITLVLLASCQQKAANEIDAGTFATGTYSNNYFGMSMEIPESWSVQDEETRQAISDVGLKVMGDDDKTLQAAYEAQAVNLLAAFQHLPGSVIENGSILCVAERVRHVPGIKRGRDYHKFTREILENSRVQASFPRDIYTETIGGNEFDVMPVEYSVMNKVTMQNQYATVIKDYVLLISVSYFDEAQKAELMKVLNTLRFE